jgi:hypothetical protein
MTDAPGNERRTDGPSGHDTVANAVEALMSKPQRGMDGRFVAANVAAVVHGTHSEQLAAALGDNRES